MSPSLHLDRSQRERGFTLLEVLMATVITLMLIGSLAVMFGDFSDKVSDSRAVTALQDNLRHVKDILYRDLQGTTAPTTPPLDPATEQGYFELVEGPIGPVFFPIELDRNDALTFPLNNIALPDVLSGITHGEDTTIGDVDDILMFTTRSMGREFVGTGTVPDDNNISKHAEIVWFMRGKTLYRGALLIRPGVTGTSYAAGVSLRLDNFRMPNFASVPSSGSVVLNTTAVANSLGDLTKRENRYGHQPAAFPHDSRFWMRMFVGTNDSKTTGVTARPTFMFPTLAETSASWPAPSAWFSNAIANSTETNRTYSLVASGIGGVPFNDQQIIIPGRTYRTRFTPTNEYASTAMGLTTYLPARPDAAGRRVFDPWSTRPLELDILSVRNDRVSDTSANNSPYNANREFGVVTRETMLDHGDLPRFDDVVMTNVLSFDLKVWDPGAPIFTLVGGEVPGLNLGGISQITVMPDDPLYKRVLAAFISNGSPKPTHYGAYVDLNYMWGGSTISKLRKKANNSSPGYLDTLEQYEKAAPLQLPLGTLPRPWFAGPGQAVSAGRLGTGYHQRHWLNYENTPSSVGTTRINLAADLVGALHEANTLPLLQDSGLASVYCTWSTHYERNGIDEDRNGIVDDYTNGVDDPFSDPGVDDPSERETVPPYPYPLRSIQIRIRAFDSDSKQIREVSLTHEFLLE